MKTLQNKYSKLYYKLVNKSSLSDYTETHHIIPKSLGGSDNKSNLIKLSAREHFLCHYLLTKMFRPNTIEYYKMVKAFMKMKSSSKNQQRYFNSYLYESKRKAFSLTQSYSQTGEKNSQFDTVWIYSMTEKRSIKIPKEDLNHWLLNGWYKGRKLNFIENKKPYKREINRIKVEAEAIESFYKFKHGNYSSVREFCRINHDKSHVYTLRIWKKYIIGLETIQGKELVFK